MRCPRKNEIVAPLFFVWGQTIHHIKANRLNYLNKVLVFWYLVLPLSFEALNSEGPSLLQKLLPLHFIAKITALCSILVTDECTQIPCEEVLISQEFKEISRT